MKALLTLLGPLLALSLSTPARADQIFLKDGAMIEGVAEERGDEVLVVLDIGTMTLRKDDVLRIEKADSTIAELQKRREKIRQGDTRGLWALAEWAFENRLSSQGRALARELIAIAPDHAQARRALGYVKHQGKWMTEEEKLEATGHVRVAGRWLTRAEADELEKREAQRREHQAQEAQLEVLAQEVELARAEADRARAEAEAARRAAEERNNFWLHPYGTGAYWVYQRYLEQTQKQQSGVDVRVRDRLGRARMDLNLVFGSRSKKRSP